MTERLALAALAGFALGSIPWGVIVLRLAGRPDPRTVGSGNIGATNVVRAGGKGLGAVTLLLDGGKGALACLLFGHGAAAAVAGLASVAGHCFTPWLRFRGGKGVATYLGACAALGWPELPVVFGLIWCLFFGLSRISAVASLQACWAAALLQAGALASGSLREAGLDAVVLAASLVLACGIVTWRHRSNFERMRRGDAAPGATEGGT